MLKPHFLLRMLGIAKWSIRFKENFLVINSDIHVNCHDIVDCKVDKGFLFDKLLIVSKNNNYTLTYVSKSKSVAVKEIVKKLFAISEASRNLDKKIKSEFYFSNSDVRELTGYMAACNVSCDDLTLLIKTLDSCSAQDEYFRILVTNLRSLISGDKSSISKRNQSFVSNELDKYSDFFNSIESSPLTEEQARASIIFEDNNLLIAAAGSGKSSTIVAKIGYALTKKIARPCEILVLAFNKSTKLELEARIQGKLSSLLVGDDKISVKTFHSLGLQIISQSRNAKPNIAHWAAGSQELEQKIIADIVKQLIEEDEGFRSSLTTYLTIWKNPLDVDLSWLADGESTSDIHQSIDNYISRNKHKTRNKNELIKTINNEYVRSLEECAIANWLFLNGINYEYEKKFHINTADVNHAQYKPDFYYPDADCWHEHFALNSSGNPPLFFEGDYLSGVEWKRNIHKQYNSLFFETHSAHFKSKAIFEILEINLMKMGITPSKRSLVQAYQDAESLGISLHYNFFRSCIKHIKINNLSEHHLRRRADLQPAPGRAHAFLDVIFPLLQAYQAKLESEGAVDFEDMIQEACHALATSKYRHNYKLIFIDEFQDISTGRAQLVKSLMTNESCVKMFAVGDDWQSIYRFAGSDISVMTHFEKHFGYSSINNLTVTFRSNQGLTDISSTFVMKNPFQIKKNVTAIDSEKTNVIAVLPYHGAGEWQNILSKAIDDLTESCDGKVISIFVLGRYNNLMPSNLKDIQKKNRGKATISYYTFHRSKGLQADFVFIVGLHKSNTSLSFPSTIADDPLINIFQPEPEDFLFSEERRLFYVALTRARHRAYLLVDVIYPSPFFEEIVGYDFEDYVSGVDDFHNKSKSICPLCKSGFMVPRKGPYGNFFGCSCYPKCSHIMKSMSEN